MGFSFSKPQSHLTFYVRVGIIRSEDSLIMKGSARPTPLKYGIRRASASQ